MHCALCILCSFVMGETLETNTELNLILIRLAVHVIYQLWVFHVNMSF